MRSLALKLAVVGSGAAIAASTSVASAASAAHAGTAAGGLAMATGGAASTVKVAAMSVALLGAAATGVVMVKQRGQDALDAHDPASATHLRQVPVERAIQPAVVANDPAQQVERIVDAPAQPTVDEVARDDDDEHGGRVRSGRRHGRASAQVPATSSSATRDLSNQADATAQQGRAQSEHAIARTHEDDSPHEARARRRAERREARAERARSAPSGGLSAPEGAAPADEIELLRSARAALTSRPRLAFTLTEQHRDEYPDGVFTQERDALAVEALMRAGEMDDARGRAEDFVRRYPSSPHAHRFRETMNIQ